MYSKLLDRRRHRLERGITQEAVAHAARLTRKTVSDFENGNISISAANLSRLLAAVGLELAVRELSRRPNLDELAQRYCGEEAQDDEPRRRARTRST
jgi:transcriptional regulator with XRE-family HTH domain